MISKDMTIDELLSKNSAYAQKISLYLGKLGLSCIGCSASSYETLEVGILSHGYDIDTVTKCVDDLNAVVSQQLDVTTITLTKRAAKRFKEICISEDIEGYGLRFSLQLGGCSGYEYLLDFAQGRKSGEVTYVSEDVDIFIAEKDKDKLLGAEIDYLDGLKDSGFKISNPNAKTSCSCGKSQAY